MIIYACFANFCELLVLTCCRFRGAQGAMNNVQSFLVIFLRVIFLPQRTPHSLSSGSPHVPPLSGSTHPSHLSPSPGRTAVTSWLLQDLPWKRERLATLASRTSRAQELQGRWYRFLRKGAIPFRNSSWQRRRPRRPSTAYTSPKLPDTFKQR